MWYLYHTEFPENAQNGWPEWNILPENCQFYKAIFYLFQASKGLLNPFGEEEEPF